MSKFDRDLSNLVNFYNQQREKCEFELRGKIYIDGFNAIVNEYKDIIVSQTLNVIINGNSNNRIITLQFVDGVNTKKNLYGTKKQLKRIDIGGIFHRIAVSEEIPLEKFEAPIANLFRFKWRASIPVDDWRIDLTVTTETTNATDVSKISSTFFPKGEKSTLENMKKHIDGQIELEAEYIGDQLTVESVKVIQDTITNLINGRNPDNVEYQNMIYATAKILNLKNKERFRYQFGLKQLGNQVFDLTKNKLHEVNQDLGLYYITDKADGERALVLINQKKMYILTSKLDVLPCDTDATIIADCEYVKQKLYVFDILYFNKSLLNENYEQRHEFLDETAKLVDGFAKKMSKMSSAVDETKSVISDFKKYVKSRPYTCDGYILTPNLPYYNEQTFKVKFPEYLSIDFLVMEAPSELIGVKPYIKRKEPLYFLFSGISTRNMEKYKMKKLPSYDKIFHELNLGDNYIPIQFAPSSHPYAYIYYLDSLNSKEFDGPGIYEMQWIPGGKTQNSIDGSWRILRKRVDRDVEFKRGNYFGNNFDIAEQIWESYKNPISIDDIYVIDESYFREHNNPLYKTARAFNSYVKSDLLSTLRGKIIDLAAGKGQDMQRYHDDTEVLFVDIDQNALQELVNRKKTMKGSRSVHVLHTDLSLNYKENVEKMSKMGFINVNHIVCNFALHYLVANENSINNIVALVKSVLAIGGTFTYTVFDGERIIELLKNGDWNVYEDTVLKYSIKKKYKTDKIALGQQIDVLLPFSDGEYYTEYLVNISYINQVFAKNGFEITMVAPFDTFKGFDIKGNDLEFVSLYTGVVLTRQK